MKYCIIHGSPRKGNCFKVTTLLKQELQALGEGVFVEFFLPQDLPHFCIGCYNCFEKGEEYCPHAKYVQPIVTAMSEADVLIFTTPVYVLAESGAMKAFLDHLAYMFMVHRPKEAMFAKVALVVSTTAGAGTGKAMKPLRLNLRFWGVKRSMPLGITMRAMSWEGMGAKQQLKYDKLIKKRARGLYALAKRRETMAIPLFAKALLWMMRKMIAGYDDTNLDKRYWQEKGWLDRGRWPYS